MKFAEIWTTRQSSTSFRVTTTVGFSGISIFTVEESVLFTASKSFMPVIIYTAAIAPTIKTEIIQIKRKVLRLYLFFALRAENFKLNIDESEYEDDNFVKSEDEPSNLNSYSGQDVSFLYKLVICSVGIFFGNHGVNGAVEHSRGQSMLYTFGVAKPNACSRKIL